MQTRLDLDFHDPAPGWYRAEKTLQRMRDARRNQRIHHENSPESRSAAELLDELTQDPNIRYAARLLRMGACILPIAKGEKGPPTPGWNNLGVERTSWTLSALRRGLDRGDNWAGGILSRRLGCLDFDTPETWQAFLDGPYSFPALLLADTPHGGHAWIMEQAPYQGTVRSRDWTPFTAEVRQRILADTGAESFRVRGSYALGPGSQVDGKRYKVRDIR